MFNSKRLYIAIGLFFVLVLLEFYLFNRQANFSHGSGTISQNIEITEGAGVKEIGQKLEDTQLVKSKYYFDYYIWKTGSRGKIKAGKYELKGTMTIPEIVQVLSLGEIVSNQTKVTFPEGTSAQGMADILKQKGLDGDAFLADVKSGSGIAANYAFLKDAPQGSNLARLDSARLEGFLFPDTYIFFKDAKPEEIVDRMLQNFDEKLTPKMREDIQRQGKNIFDVVTMASILEKEVQTADDMKIASGIFWDRISVGMPLQSCATIAYVLGREKKQYSVADTRTSSPYNTYINKGLPPGPIDNPGMNSILAAIYPTKTDYNYFLTDPATGKTIFSKTLEEHAANKAKYGL
ncbi:MAG: endolytic transglycosylase MltG [Candidatus Moranbacteria bacterium]|nr:endolytic transglycosylase MltG [Candidatus Moranbacteria bacterium]